MRAGERARLAGMARSLQVDVPASFLQWPVELDERPPVVRRRRLLTGSGWPVRAAVATGLLMILSGLKANSGWPLLIGARLAMTGPTWLLLPPLRPGRRC